ncbi:L,D-transpeptidase [Komarekiella sp. 'clone 1']|uniref:L,D-transpeptidase n=1 Tax=Komarekiella delphini-convector SJRDD-AB1 TaxID=2593771 RepID=A0AA40T297_9NOST|nr:L,D-transpeptidase [Komarekiella delphini-convector]MBD6619299.1 L,D-transpeptidase [Komarekiella delphini-convector SJRDD-AB1]
MPIRLTLISFSCVAFIGCAANAELKLPQKLISLQPSKNLKQTTEKLTIGKEKWSEIDALRNSNSGADNNDPLYMGASLKNVWIVDNDESNKDNFQSQKISTVPIRSNSYMVLIPKGVLNALENPIYELRLYANGELKGSYKTVSGRSYTQNKDRDSSGTEAPLPNGKYKVARTYIHGAIPEAGDRFLPIQPLFQTGRTDLGIHYDPSFEKNNGEDGTSGCIGLTDKQDLNRVLEYVRIHRPQYLEVTI